MGQRSGSRIKSSSAPTRSRSVAWVKIHARPVARSVVGHNWVGAAFVYGLHKYYITHGGHDL